MLRIKTPATSANVGPGFDCLGIAFTIYNTFDVELSDSNILEGVEERFNNEDNLFLQAYRKGCQAIGVSDHIHVKFQCDIPTSRGLGSSASLISAGIIAAGALHDDALTQEQIFQLASEMEGHPDNAAPCVFGGFTASAKIDGTFMTHQIPLDSSWKYTLFTPDFEVSTASARAILPDSYSRSTAAANSASAILTTEALRTGSLSLLKAGARDAIHEPYRKTLIHDFDEVKRIVEEDTSGVFLISGSGSTCLLISRKDLSQNAVNQIHNLAYNWQIRSTTIAANGSEVTTL